MKTVLVVTSIAPSSSPPLRGLAQAARNLAADFLVVGDRKSPSDFRLDGCDHWDLARQLECPFELATKLPLDHYARKNIGYLLAMAREAEVILETDDDNVPLEGFGLGRETEKNVPHFRGFGWVNVYDHFAPDRPVWPRGFPLSLVQEVPSPRKPGAETCFCPIQQGLVQENPDVDAIYRLTRPLPVSFRARNEVALGPGSWSPFNSQNTAWFREAFPLMYLPSRCGFRVTDIWRSFVAQAIAHANGWSVLFHGPTVRHERNDHDLMKDFADEIPMYRFSREIPEKLSALPLSPGADRICENLRICYRSLVELGGLPEEELPLLETWIKDLARATAKS